MSEFERFGLICEEWLDAAKGEDLRSKEEDTKKRITTSVGGVSESLS